MAKYERPFLVLPSRELIPLEGVYRVEDVDGEWYVLGQHQATACESEAEAMQRLKERMLQHDAHALAAEALEGLPIDYAVVAERA